MISYIFLFFGFFNIRNLFKVIFRITSGKCEIERICSKPVDLTNHLEFGIFFYVKKEYSILNSQKLKKLIKEYKKDEVYLNFEKYTVKEIENIIITEKSLFKYFNFLNKYQIIRYYSQVYHGNE